MSEDWALHVSSVTDGDTIRGHLNRQVSVVDGWALTVHSTNPKGEPLRLVILDTPERGEEGFGTARQHVIDWCSAYAGRLRVETYTTGGFDRLLADVYVEGDRGHTLSQHMLLMGWEPYIK